MGKRSLYGKLQDFGSLTYTVGDGSAQDKVTVNDLSRGNAHRAAQLVQINHDALLFIAGGNCGEKGKRGDGIHGSLQEAQRMKHYIADHFPASVSERVLTDCDAEFYDRYKLDPSYNTIENARNTVALLQDGQFPRTNIVAEQFHMLRVIATLRKALEKIGLLSSIDIAAYPVMSVFEPHPCYPHISSERQFHRWNRLANMHHLALGAVRRCEFLYELLSGNHYKHLYAQPPAKVNYSEQ